MFCLNQQVLMYYQRNKRESGGRKEDDEDDAKMQAHIKDFKKKRKKSCNRAANDCNNEGSRHNYLRLNIFPLDCGAVNWNEKSWGNESCDGAFYSVHSVAGYCISAVWTPRMSGREHQWWCCFIRTRQNPNPNGELISWGKDILTAKGYLLILHRRLICRIQGCSSKELWSITSPNFLQQRCLKYSWGDCWTSLCICKDVCLICAADVF